MKRPGRVRSRISPASIQPYEAPEQAELTIRTVEAPPEMLAETILRHLRDGGYI